MHYWWRYTRAGDLAKLLYFCIIENFGYRQITLWARATAFFRFFRGDMTWGIMTREGPRTAPARPEENNS